MQPIPVIAIFDVGKTNKKLLLFNEKYEVVHEESWSLPETKDEDGFPCEDVSALTQWIKETFQAILTVKHFDVKAVNFSGYGASFVYLDGKGNVLLPLYNYLKPYPPKLQKQFYDTYGGESQVAKQTASPVLGNLNSGMQLYRLKQEKPAIFADVKYALHLPQYLSFILSGKTNADLTSIGCHTSLWHYQKNSYHEWVQKEGITDILPAIKDVTEVAGYTEDNIPVGVGLHDSSAALVPYLITFKEPFVLLSTGTWCITLNPFNHSILTDYELHNDCLCYISFMGNPVKASRLFAGNEHEQQVKRLASHFLTDVDHYKKVKADEALLNKFKPAYKPTHTSDSSMMIGESGFSKRNLSDYKNYYEAYHQLIADIMEQQVRSTSFVLKGAAVKRIFVDGGFSKNPIYMQLLADAFPEIEVFAATVAQASSLGAAMVMHKHWNGKAFPSSIVEIKKNYMNESLDVLLQHPAKQITIAIARIYSRGLTTTSGGNISVIDDDDNIWITPSGIDKGSLTEKDIICVKPDGSFAGMHKPSSEFPFHKAIYQARKDIKAIIHAHPPALVSYSIVRQIPKASIVSQARQVCGQIGYAEYELPGSEALGKEIADEFNKGYSSVIMENHGTVVGGSDLSDCFQRFETLEFCARTGIYGSQIGKLNELSDELIDEVNAMIPADMPEQENVEYSSDERKIRDEIYKIVKRACQHGLMISSYGTVSARWKGDDFLITPYGISRWDLQVKDIVQIRDGHKEPGKVPSRSVYLHQEIYRKHPEINTIILTQSPYLMSFASTGVNINVRTIPESWIFLKDIHQLEFGVQYKNIEEITKRISPEKPAVLIKNDCVLIAGKGLLQTFDYLEVAEFSARSLVMSSAIGSFVPISDEQTEELRKAFLK